MENETEVMLHVRNRFEKDNIKFDEVNYFIKREKPKIFNNEKVIWVFYGNQIHDKFLDLDIVLEITDDGRSAYRHADYI